VTHEGILACTGTPQLGCGLALDQFSQIPAGTFQMGSTAYTSSEQPVHSVTISRTFYMQKTEVTQGQWRAVMGSNPSYFSTCGDTCPVEQVSWDDITTFLQRLNAQTPGVTYRLPTEAEWEYAARAGTTGETYGTLDSIAWYSGNSTSKTHAAAGKQANAWGLYDMIGNVWEWVNDWHGSYSSASVTDPTGPATGTVRVLRAGSCYSPRYSARAAYRDNGGPSGRRDSVGFRLVRTP
jgi:formylglycine-generating enzyme required for sulfatase activity